jgi:amino acid transporter
LNKVKAKTGSENGNNVPGLGTFGGVFTPSILTILGVIMYLRLGWVVGNVGLIGTLVIVTISTSITLLTALSIASIATDQKVKTGGAYFMISRTLGIETGGAVGIPLFIAQTLSIALYTLGFAESFASIFPYFDETTVALLVTVIIGVVAMISANVAIKTQYFILGAIALSLISLFLGKPLEPELDAFRSPGPDSENFWKVFAIFFPAVTGIMSGVNMSGDLQNPSRSIPVGTILAVGVGFLIYMVLPVVLASRVDTETLISDPLVMRRISFWGDTILLGVWGATLSSALGSILGAPRVLQALAKDKVLPGYLRFLARGSGKDNTPRYGTIFSLVIALVAVYFGNLNLIAPILTMFFLTTYGVLNITSAVENFLGNPSFRPTFTVSWVFSLLGAFGCVVVMFLIDPVSTVVATFFIILIFIWLEKQQLRTSWSDVRQGMWMSVTRASLLKIKKEDNPKSWFPHLLILSGAPTSRWHLIALSHSLIRSRGLMTVTTIIPPDQINLERQQTMEANTREFLLNKGIKCLVRIISAPNVYEGGIRLVETYGLGNLTPNTFVLGATENIDHIEKYSNQISKIHEANRNVLIVKDNEKRKFGLYERIDIWWAGLKGNGALMILLGHLITKSPQWHGAEVTLKFVASDQRAAEEATKNLDSMISEMRIDVKKEIISSDGRKFHDILSESSSRADLVFLGLKEPDDDYAHYLENFFDQISDLPATVLVLAGQKMDFSKVLS